MQYEHLAIELEGPRATVTLNRPEVRNAMDERTLEELEDCFLRLGVARPFSSARGRSPLAPPLGVRRGPQGASVAPRGMAGSRRGAEPDKDGGGVRAIVLRANGPDFCAGADLRWMRRAAGYSPAKNRKDAQRLVRALRAIDECPAPVVARVHGGVYGGGLGLVSACDIVVAEAGARMCFSECRLGILPAIVSSFVLPKIGLGQTRRLYLTSEVFGMETALRVGLVHEAVPAAELDAAVDRTVEGTLANGPRAARLAKAYLRRMESLPRAARIRLSVDTLVQARSSDEAREGFAAFLEKRAPSWRR